MSHRSTPAYRDVVYVIPVSLHPNDAVNAALVGHVRRGGERRLGTIIDSVLLLNAVPATPTRGGDAAVDQLHLDGRDERITGDAEPRRLEKLTAPPCPQRREELRRPRPPQAGGFEVHRDDDGTGTSSNPTATRSTKPLSLPYRRGGRPGFSCSPQLGVGPSPREACRPDLPRCLGCASARSLNAAMLFCR